MTTARQVVHVLRKDVVQLRWWLAAYVLLATAATTLAAQPMSPGRSGWMEVLVPLLWLLGGIIAATGVQTDAPSRPEAFWASRPIGVGALLAAKLAIASLLLVVPLLGELLLLWSIDVPTDRIITMATAGTLLYAAWLLICMVVAASTRQLVGFVGTMIAVPAMLAVIAIATEGSPWELKTPAGSGVVLQAIATAAAAALLLFLYHRRQRGLPWQIASGAMLAVGILSVTAPVVRASLEPVRDAAPSALTLTLDSLTNLRVGEPDGAILTMRGMQWDKRYEFRADSVRMTGRDGISTALSVVVGAMAPLNSPLAVQAELPVGDSSGVRLYWFPRPDSALRQVRVHGTVEASRATVLGTIRTDRDTTIVDNGVRLHLRAPSRLTGQIRLDISGAFADRVDILELFRMGRAYALRTSAEPQGQAASVVNYQNTQVSQRLLPLPGTSLHSISRLMLPASSSGVAGPVELVRWDVVERFPVVVERTSGSP